MKTDIHNKISDFNHRWNLSSDDNRNIENFRKRCLNSFCKILGFKFIINNKADEEFSEITAIHSPDNIFSIGLDIKFNPQDSLTYKSLNSEKNLTEFLFLLESITIIQCIDIESKNEFIDSILKNIEITSLPISGKKIDNEILFYPKGAKLLDEKLINNNLDWLKNYKSSYKQLVNVLQKLEKGNDERNIIDDLRLTLESFLKEKLNNSKSLENQISEIGKFLKEQNTSEEITNLFKKLLDYYAKYQNENIKHSSNAKKDEVEFILYLTCNFIRFIILK